VCTYDKNQKRVYIDGSISGSESQSGGIPTNDDVLRIGDFFDQDSFKGKVDNVRIYDRALSADEVEKLYRLGE